MPDPQLAITMMVAVVPSTLTSGLYHHSQQQQQHRQVPPCISTQVCWQTQHVAL